VVLVHASDWQQARGGFMPRKPPQQFRLALKCNPGDRAHKSSGHQHKTWQQQTLQAHRASGYTKGGPKRKRRQSQGDGLLGLKEQGERTVRGIGDKPCG